MSPEPVAASGALEHYVVDLVGRIKASRLETAPFDHVNLEDVFSPVQRKLVPALLYGAGAAA